MAIDIQLAWTEELDSSSADRTSNGMAGRSLSRWRPGDIRKHAVKKAFFLLGWVGWLACVSAAPGLVGDANGDGKVDQADAQTILRKAVSTVVLGATESARADVNGDGQINALDALLVLKSGPSHPSGGLNGFSSVATLVPRGAEVTLFFQETASLVAGDVQVRLLDLNGTVVDSQTAGLRESAEGKEGKVTFQWASPLAVVDLAGYIVEVSGQIAGNPFLERQSLYQLVPRMTAHVFGPKVFLSGGRERMRVVAEEQPAGRPLPGASVQISLQPNGAQNAIPLYHGLTDVQGVADAALDIPAGYTGDAKLAVRVSSAAGDRVLEQPVELQERFATFLTTDKPLYQPGQTIHIRSLTLKKPEMLPPAGREIAITVADSKGNKVFRQVKAISEFGIAFADFTLATELNLGTYTVSATLGEHQAERQVTVKRYALPKFKVALETDRSYYLPAGKLSGTVAADYFFGKPVAGAAVTIAASKFDVGFAEFAKVTGTTDPQGRFTFSLDLPAHFVGQPLQQGEAFALLDVSVEDGAAHVEKINRTVPVAASELVVLLVPESGRLVSGVENKVYLLTTYPDNTPARTRCVASAGGQTLGTINTDEVGIGILQFTPAGASELVVTIQAEDTTGNRAQKAFTLALDQSTDSLLLRTDRTLYRVGDEVLVDIFGGALGGSIFVDVIKEGQTLYSRSLEPEGGRTSLVIPLAPEMAGTLTVSAYRLTLGSNTIRDRRVIYVDPARDLRLSYELNKSTYLPGEDATIHLRVSDAQNQPVTAAVGLNIVDESVFALQEMQPGMEKIYFYLEEQLRKPRYEIHGFEPEVIIQPPSIGEPILWRDQALGLMFASTAAEETGTFSLSSNGTDTAQLRSKVIDALWKDLDLLITALSSSLISYPEDRATPFFASVISEAIEAGKLKTDVAEDPWGVPYRIRYQRSEDRYTFESAGPDQRWSTSDDLVIAALQWTLRDPFLRRNPDFILRRGVEFDFAADAVFLAPPAANNDGVGGGVGTKGASETPYLRQYFPETLYSNPAIITGPDGSAELNLKVADSITSWRLTGLASSANGRLGSATAAFRVFQEFFVDLDLPPTLTRGDEVSIPVAIYNYLGEAQDIRLVLQPADWFELAGASEKTVRIGANQVSVAHFPIKAIKVGGHRLQVTAYGNARSDAIARAIEIVPDGQEVLVSHSGRLEGSVEHTITIPESAVEGGSKIFVKIYPGLFSQVVEGLDSLLQMPFGCFEQTSSVTYPNVLALHYMKTVGQATPEIIMKAEGFISTGYQRLLSFEVTGGGFEWFGNPPAHNVLTTYGLMEFSDMSKVWYVDPAVIQRTQDWLVKDQKSDGSWIPTEGGIAEGAINRYQNDVLRTTAYVVWGLQISGYSGPAIASGLNYVRGQLAKPASESETYTLALCAHALLQNPNDSLLPGLFQEFEARKKVEGDTAWWESDAPTITFSRGKGADVELTALLAQAYMRYGLHPDTAAKALNYLIAAKDPRGNFGSTQATVLALQAFSMAASGITRPPDATVTISINGQDAQPLKLNDTNKDLLFLVDLQQHTRVGDNQVRISLQGTGSCLYQVVGRSYVPWKLVDLPVEEPISLEVTYDKTELTTHDTVRCNVKIANNRSAKAKMIVIDVGLPPGFNVLTEDLDPLVGVKFQKYQLTPRQGIFYIEELARETPVEFSFRLAAQYPIRALTPQSVVYEYYNPEIRAVSAPQQLAVSDDSE